MTFILFDCLSKILFLTREDKSHIFKSQCNVLFIIYCSPKQKIVKIHAQKQIGKSHMIDISSLVKIWKYLAVYFSESHSLLYNKKLKNISLHLIVVIIFSLL
jgi:hypothetical protein